MKMKDTIEQIEIPGLRLVHTGRKNQDTGEQLARFDRFSINGYDIDSGTTWWTIVELIQVARKLASVGKEDLVPFSKRKALSERLGLPPAVLPVCQARTELGRIIGTQETAVNDEIDRYREMIALSTQAKAMAELWKKLPPPPELQGILRADLLGCRLGASSYCIHERANQGQCHPCDRRYFPDPNYHLRPEDLLFVVPIGKNPFGNVAFRFHPRVQSSEKGVEEFDVWQIKLNGKGEAVLP